MNKPIHPAVAEHVMEENDRLREALQAMLDECDPMKLNCGEPWCRARAALSQQAEPLYVTHRPLIRNAISLLGMRRPVAPDVQRVIDDLEAMLGGQSTPAGAPSEEWLQVATLAEPAPAQDEREGFEECWAVRGADDEGNLGKKPLRSLVDQQRYRGDAVNGSWVWFQRGAAWQRTRPAQTEQHPAGWEWIEVFVGGNFDGEEVNDGFYRGADRLDLRPSIEGVEVRQRPLYAGPIAQTAPVNQATDGGRNPRYEGLFDGETEQQRAERLASAQTAPQPEQSGLVEAAGAVIRVADWWAANEDSPKSALAHFARAADALRAALSAQPET